MVIEAVAAISGRPVRSVLTALGIATGVTALTAIIGMSTSAADSIDAEFAALQATRVEVAGPESVGEFDALIGAPGLARAATLNGAIAVGASATSRDGFVSVRALPAGRPAELPLIATQGSLLAAEKATVVAGRLPDVARDNQGDRVIVLGVDAAAQVGVSADRIPSRVAVNGTTFVVAGIVRAGDPASMIPSAVTMSMGAARTCGLDALLGAPVVVIRSAPGAGVQIGREAPLALSPTQPDRLSAAVPPSPTSLESAVREQTRLQLLALALISVIVGAMGVSNTTLVGVMERRPEIGVRRAVGASSTAIVTQFLLESAVLGLLGGAVGSVAGLVVTFVVTAINSWHLVLPGWLLLLGPGLGFAVGLLAGAYPAYRASRIEPIEALRA
ncbi:MAG: ABC transporter permease [Nocardioides sp.]